MTDTLTEAQIKTFWAMVNRQDGCWLWTGSLMSKRHPYGIFRFRGRNQKAHRMAWELTNGPIPTGMFVCHKCDVPRCINPHHLFLGTPGDNVRDMIAKGRGSMQLRPHNSYFVRNPLVKARGEQCRSAKLTRAIVAEIRASIEPTRVLAARYGVVRSTIKRVRAGSQWSWL